MKMQAHVAAGCAALSAAVLCVCAEEWSESTLYITRTGPAQPAVQERQALRAAKAEPARQQPEPAAERAAMAPADGALERGIVRAAAAPRALEPAARSDRETPSAAASAATPAARAASLLRPRTDGQAAAAAASTAVTIDKFVDQNNDGYDDRAQADDL